LTVVVDETSSRNDIASGSCLLITSFKALVILQSTGHLPLHSSRLAAPGCSVVNPAGHVLQLVCPSLSWYCPGTHGTHRRRSLRVPRGQFTTETHEVCGIT